MKKIFTLVAMAMFAIGVNAQEENPYANFYEVKTVEWGDVTWKNGNNKKDKDGAEMLFLMGTGNGYQKLWCEYFYSDDKGDYVSRPGYTYVNYEGGEKGLPGVGLYYQFTPAVAGTLKMNLWVNKGNRKTFVLKGDTPLVPYTDYGFEGYVNGQNNAETNNPIFFTQDEIKARHEAFGSNLYVIDQGNQAVWGWLVLNVEAGVTYTFYQQSSQLGFGGYEFTPAGGEAEAYVSCINDGTAIVLAPEFAAVIDADGKATNVTDGTSFVDFKTTNVVCKAAGSATPTDVTPDLEWPYPGKTTGISNVKVEAQNATAGTYNLAGQRVSDSYKGLVIKNGKKTINK